MTYATDERDRLRANLAETSMALAEVRGENDGLRSVIEALKEKLAEATEQRFQMSYHHPNIRALIDRQDSEPPKIKLWVDGYLVFAGTTKDACLGFAAGFLGEHRCEPAPYPDPCGAPEPLAIGDTVRVTEAGDALVGTIVGRHDRWIWVSRGEDEPWPLTLLASHCERVEK